MVGGKGAVRGNRRLFSYLRWGIWVSLFCAAVLAVEWGTGYYTLTGSTSNRAFVLFALVLLIAVSLVKPEISLVLAAFFMPLLRIAFPGIRFLRGHLANIDIVHPLIFGALLGWLARAIHRREPLFEGNPATIPIFLFFGWSALSLLWCVDPVVGKFELQDLAFNIMIYVACIKLIRSRATLNMVITALILTGVFVTWVGLNNVLTGVAARVEVMTGEPNAFSLALNLVIMLVLGMLFLGGSKLLRPWFLWPLFITMFFVDLRTGSRAGFFSLLAALLFFLFSYYSLNKDKRHLTFVLFLVMLLLAGGLFLVFFDPLEGLRIGFRGYNPMEFAEEETFLFRLEIWQVAWDYISSSGRYLQGLGILSFIMLTKEEYGVMGQAHSLYFNAGVSYGLVGLSLLVWIIVVFVRQFRRGMREAREEYYRVMVRAMAAGMLAFAIHGIVDFWIEQIRIVWLFAGIAMAVVKLALQNGEAVGGDSGREDDSETESKPGRD